MIKKLFCVIYGKYKEFEKPKVPLSGVNIKMKIKKHLKEKNELKYQKFLV